MLCGTERSRLRELIEPEPMEFPAPKLVMFVFKEDLSVGNIIKGLKTTYAGCLPLVSILHSLPQQLASYS